MVAAADKYTFVVRWRPFLLRPALPPEGMPKPAEQPGMPRVPTRLKQAGDSVGIDFSGKCDRYPNTLRAHALLEYAKEKDDGTLQNQLMEAVFKAYFTDGIYPDSKNLVALAEKVGIKKGDAEKVVSDQDWLDEAHDAARTWTRRGVTSVPCFYINDQRTFSGAQDIDAFLRMFDIIAERFPLVHPSASTASAKT